MYWALLRYEFCPCFSLVWFVLIYGTSTTVGYLMPNPFIYTYHLSSCRAISTDIPDPLLPSLSIVHHFRQVLRFTHRILTELLYVGSSWSPWFCSVMRTGPSEYITYELVPTSPAVSCMSGSSNLDSFRDKQF